MLKGKRILILIFIVFCIYNYELYAQQQRPLVNLQNRGAQYLIGSEDELLIKVNIWGFVTKPGQYMIPSNTDLISLISYAGGPQPGAKLSKIKIVRRSGQNEKEKIIKVDVNEYLDTAKESLIPILKPDDTIIISGSKWNFISKSLEFVTKVAYLAQIWSWIAYYDKN